MKCLFLLPVLLGALAASAATPSLPALIREYEADEGSVGTFYNVPWSASRFEHREKLNTGWLARLEQLDFAALAPADQVDYTLLRLACQTELAHIARDRQRLVEMKHLLAFHGTIEKLELARWREGRLDGAAAATAVSDLAKQVKQLRERVEKGKGDAKDKKDEKKPDAKKTEEVVPLKVAPALALRAAGAVGQLRETLKGWFKYYDGFKPEASWWLKKPCEDADKELEDYAKLLKEEIAGQKGKDEDPLVGESIGAAALAEEIRCEFLPYSAAELIAIGEREFAWCEAEMKKAARKMGCGDDWKAALARVKTNSVPPGAQDELVAQYGRDATAFVAQHKFVTVPPLCSETWRVTMMSPETLKNIPYAAYNNQHMLVAYANQVMKQEDKLMVMRGNNRAFTRLTVPHELIPGHHLQLFVAARSNQHRRLFGTPFYIEGWALYCELRLWELGWARTPEDKLGMLFWRMHRAERIVLSLKYHLGQMTPDEMVNFMVERAGHEKFGATSEVRRFIGAPPLYQAGYMIGGLQLLALHDEMTGRGKLAEQPFNDAVLQENTMPIELLRATLKKLPLARDAQPGWKFAGEKPAGDKAK
jgi:uncharacterized protein (DUF885 family)